MKVVITGGGGFLGNQLAKALITRGCLVAPSGEPEPIDELLLVDIGFPEAATRGLPEHVRTMTADAGDPAVLRELIDRDDLSVFHLASMVSGECEVRFDDALRTNLDGGRHLLEALRNRAGQPRLVFTSSVAVFGGDAMMDPVSDRTKATPQTTYGMTKFMLELLVNDYTRKGFLDGRSARLPTVVIRPGRPNAAASSWASGMFREPIRGEACELPVARDQPHPLIGHRDVIESLIALHEAAPARLGADRNFGLPSHTVTPDQARTVLEKVAGQRGLTLGPLVDRPDPVVRRIVGGWPTATDGSRAIAAGCPAPRTLDRMIEDYLDDFT